MDSVKKMKRLARVFSILSKYGFDEVISRLKIIHLLPENIRQKSSRAEDIFQLSMYERLRMALEELGPTFVKFGQLLSNREDVLPKELLTELEKLQDNVPPGNMDVSAKLVEYFDIDIAAHFEYIDPIPMASASISQVYRARLITGEEVVIKVKRDNIQPTIEADLLLMKDLAELLEKHYEKIRQMYLKQVVASFEANLHQELSLVNEMNNIERFRRNFAGDERIYVPKTYKEYSNNNILCMEFIDGFKINDKQQILEMGMDPATVADTGLNLYLKQVLEHGFFHADPHPGNVFINKHKQIVFIDFGSVGSMMPSEKEDLENIIINFILKDAKRLIKGVKKIAISYSVPDDQSLEREVHGVLEMLDVNSLEEIDLNSMVLKIKAILANNYLLLPGYIYMLIKGISLLEGVGRQLDPNLNITASIKPYAFKLMKQRFSPERLMSKGIDGFRTVMEAVEHLPSDALLLLEKIKDDQLIVNHKIKGLDEFRLTMRNAINRLVYAMIIAALSIGSAILVMADIPPKIMNIPVLGVVGFSLSGILGMIIIFSIWKKDK